MAESMKERIIESSILLFNRDGTHRITTNHIIDYLGISPGTFYYHFRNKEEIILNIFSRITDDFASVFEITFNASGISGMIAGLKKVFALYNKYSFFYNEISSLLDRDEKLNELYLENYRLKTEMLKKQFALMEDAGMLIRGFSKTPEALIIIDSLWMLSDYWVTFLKTAGRLEHKAVLSGYKNYLVILKPYLTQKAAREAAEFL